MITYQQRHQFMVDYFCRSHKTDPSLQQAIINFIDRTLETYSEKYNPDTNENEATTVYLYLFI